MTVRKCPSCGNDFEADQPWKRVCLDCWKTAKDRRESRQIEQLQEQVEYWRGIANGGPNPEVDRLRRRVAVLETQLNSRSATIPPEMLKRLLMLSHPDRHNNSPMANKVTAWLLDLR